MAGERKDWKGISYKINDRQPQFVIKRIINGSTYYNCIMEKKTMEGEKIRYYRPIRFAKCEPPQHDKNFIMIKKGFEDFFPNKLDPYNPITVIVVLEWEEFGKKSDADVNKAYHDFTDTAIQLDNLDLPF